MNNKEKILDAIVNAREVIQMLLDEIGKLEVRSRNGAISTEDAMKYARSWEHAIQAHYVEIDMLRKKLFEKKTKPIDTL